MDDSLARTVSRPDKVNKTNPTVVAAVGFSLVRPAAHVCLCGESPLIARPGEDLATRQSQGGNKLMKEADNKASARRTGI